MNKIQQIFNIIVEKIRLMQKSRKIILVSASVLVLIALAVLVFARPERQKFMFFFPLRNDSSVIRTETRYLPAYTDLNRSFNGFISELLLGPFSHEYIPLFNSDSRVAQAFVSNKAAYVNISSKTIEPEEDIADYEIAWELFKKNVCTNYRSIGKIYLYINGIEVYSENPTADAVIIK